MGGGSPRQIAKRLNHEAVKGPFGGPEQRTVRWKAGLESPSLHQESRRGRRVSRLNPRSEWITKEVLELRIVSDELWDNAKRRQDATRRVLASATSILRARRPQYLFSGLTKCGACGSGLRAQIPKSIVLLRGNRKGHLQQSSDDPTRRKRNPRPARVAGEAPSTRSVRRVLRGVHS